MQPHTHAHTHTHSPCWCTGPLNAVTSAAKVSRVSALGWCRWEIGHFVRESLLQLEGRVAMIVQVVADAMLQLGACARMRFKGARQTQGCGSLTRRQWTRRERCCGGARHGARNSPAVSLDLNSSNVKSTDDGIRMMESTNKQFFISLQPGSALARSVRFGQHPKLHLTRVTTEGVDQCLAKHSERQIQQWSQFCSIDYRQPNHEHSYLFVCLFWFQ